MPLIKKLNRVMNVPDVDIDMYKANGYEIYQYQTAPVAEEQTANVKTEEMERGKTPAPDSTNNGVTFDYNDMPDEELAAIAAEKDIDISDKTRRQVINALKKVVGE